MKNTKKQKAIFMMTGIIALTALIVIFTGCASMRPPAFAGTYEKDIYKLIISGSADPFSYVYQENGVNSTKGTLTFSLSTAREKFGIGMSDTAASTQIEGALLTLIDEFQWDGSQWVAIDPVAVTYNYTWFYNTGKLYLGNGTDWPFLEGTWDKWIGD